MNKIYMQKDNIPEDCNHCNFNIDKKCVASKEYEFDGYTVLCCPQKGKSRGCPIRDLEESIPAFERECWKVTCDVIEKDSKWDVNKARKETAKKIIGLLKKDGKFQLFEQTIAVKTCINLIAQKYEVEVKDESSND